MSSEKYYNTLKLTELFEKKKYSEIVYIIDFEIPDEKKSLELINLLGTCRLLLGSKTPEDLVLAIENFRIVFQKEKKIQTSNNAFRNFITAALELFQLSNHIKNLQKANEYFEEAIFYFKKNENSFLNNELIILSILDIYKAQNDIENERYYLDILIKKEFYDPKIICSYIFKNSYFYNWSQEKFLEYGRLLYKNLPNYKTKEIKSSGNFKDDKIKVGFLSADIRNKHSVTYFLKTVIDNYNKEKYEIIFYYNQHQEQEDQTTEYFNKKIDKFYYINHLKDEEAINLIRREGIDILIDLMGITSESRLSIIKNRVAPTQILWCGYCNTSGVKQMDYILADPNLVLDKEKNLYEEKIVFLPKIWNCHSGFNLKRTILPAPFLKNQYLTFGSFNNFSKVNDIVVSTWSKILRSIPNSRLILKSSNTNEINFLSNKFKKENVLSSVIFKSYQQNFQTHLKLYEEIDIVLDTFPYNGVTTSFEAIWMGVPVITMKGYNFNSRCGESINKNLNISWLVSENKDDYISKAIELSKNKDYFLDIRKKIYDNALSSPLFDTKSFAKDFFKIIESLKSKF